MIQLMKRAVRSLNYRIFRNKVRPDINLLYALYHLLTMATSALRGASWGSPEESMATLLRNQGYCVLRSLLPDSDIRKIGARVNELLAQDIREVTAATESLPVSSLKDSLRLCPIVEEFLVGGLIDILRAFFRAEVQLIRTEVYRLHPSSHKLGHSWLWHFDNVPRQIIKAMVYLADTDRQTGALSLIPRPKSRDLQQRGFWDRHNLGPLSLEVNDPKNSFIAEGAAGTIVLFSAHYCLHKATPPRYGFRDAIVFTFQPSFRSLSAGLPNARKAGEVKWAYHANPFTRRPMSAEE